MKRVLFSEAEIADHSDFQAIGEHSQEATDGIWLDAIGYPAHWAAFTVSRQSAQIVTVSAGRYVNGKIVYEQAEPTDLNLQLQIPAAASDQRWVAILLRGEEITETENRPFESSEDPETSEIVNRTTPKTIKRIVKLITQAGEANPVPVKPVVAPTDACIAFVLLKSTGVDTIETGNDSRVKSLYEVEGRVAAIEVDLDSLFLRTETIETQIVNIWGKLTEIPRPEIIRQMQRDIGAARLRIDLPDEARAYAFDDALVPDMWEVNTHADWLARIEEGVRFGFSAIAQARLEVQAEDDPKIAFRGRRMVPAFDEVTRIANTSLDASLNISQLVHLETTMIRKEASRTRTIYGPTQEVCENNAGWAALRGDTRAGQVFTVNGEQFEVVGYLYGNNGHRRFGVRTIREETYIEPYWDFVTEEVGVNGSVYGQTFLVAQPMMMTSLDLSFARVGTDGDVHVFVVETTTAGTPKFDAMLAQGVLTHAQLVAGWNKVVLPVTLLESGKRYAFVTVTTGAHSLHTSGANKYTGGSQFLTTDGAFAQGSTEIDICFRVNGARFRSPRTVVPMQALNLADGMTQIDMLFAGWIPGGCQLRWEIRPAGSTVWTELDDGEPEDNPLFGLPASVELRMVMLGTTDLQPMIQLDDKAVSRVARNRNALVGVSKPVNFGLSTTSIVTQYTLDAFDVARHTFQPSIMVGNTVVNPTSTQLTIDPNRPERRTYVSTYALGAAASSARMRVTANTNNVVSVPFVQDVFIAAL